RRRSPGSPAGPWRRYRAGRRAGLPSPARSSAHPRSSSSMNRPSASSPSRANRCGRVSAHWATAAPPWSSPVTGWRRPPGVTRFCSWAAAGCWATRRSRRSSGGRRRSRPRARADRGPQPADGDGVTRGRVPQPDPAGGSAVKAPAHHLASKRRRRAGQYFASVARTAAQLRADPPTTAIVLVMPLVLITLLYFVFVDAPAPPGEPDPFQRIGPVVLAVLPMMLMFIVTSVTMLRERTSGTLERLLTTPLSRWNLLASYGAASG